ncbi:hypothetical protein Tco_0762548 [Tanacetum coccineum]
MLRRLPHKYQVDAKAAIEVAAMKAITELAGFYEGCHTAKKVKMELAGSCGGFDGDHRNHMVVMMVMPSTRSPWESPLVEMLRPLGFEEGPSTRPSTGPSTGPLTGPSTRPSTRPSIGPSTAPSAGPSTGPSTGLSMGPSTGPSTGP